jgi:hypothetical protein
MSRSELDVSDRLAKVRDLNARELSIDPTLIASKATLYALGRNDPDAWNALMPWQRDLLERPPASTPASGTKSAQEMAVSAESDEEEFQPPLVGLD